MSLLDEVISNTPDPIIVPKGQYQMQITKAVFGATKGGQRDDGSKKPIKPMVTLYLKILNEQNAQMVSDFLWFPVEGDSEDVQLNQAQKIKNTLKALGINPKVDGDVDIDKFAPGMEPIPFFKWQGKSGWAILSVGVNVSDGSPMNQVSIWIKPKEGI